MLLDIAIGIVVSLFLSHAFSIPLTPMFLGLGILFSLAPDADVLLNIKNANGAMSHQHRDLFHYPLLFVPTGMILLAFWDFHLSLLFGITALLHFMHDSIGIGWGVQWFYPFSRNHYAFLYHYRGPNDTQPKKLFYSWRHEDIPNLAQQYGDEHWFRNIYLRLHPYAIVEALAFVVALILLWRYW